MSMVPCAAPAFPLTRQPRQSLPWQPRPSCSRNSLGSPSCAQPRPSCSRGSLGSPSRAQPWPFCSRDSLGSPSRAQTKPSRSRGSVGSPFRAQTWPSCSRGSLGSPSRAQTKPSADLAFPLTRRIKIRPSYVRGSLLRTGGLWNPFLSPGRIAGHSRVALWPYCHLHEEFRLCWQTEIGADGLDF